MKIRIMLLSLCLYTGIFCQAQNPNIPNAQGAIQNLIALQTLTNVLTIDLNGLNYGPFNLNIGCDANHHWSWSCFCYKWTHWTYTWSFPDYGGFMNSFKGLNNQLFSDISNFNPSYQPLRSWFTTTLPVITTSFQTLTNSNPGNISVNLNNTLSLVNNAQSQLSNAIASLGSWSNTIQNDYNAIYSNSQSLQYSITTDSVNVQNYVKGMACGSGDLFNQWAGIKNSVVSQINGFMTNAANLGFSTSSINQNLGNIESPLVTMQFKLNDIQSKLQAGKMSNSDAVMKINSIISLDAWNQLTQLAQSAF